MDEKLPLRDFLRLFFIEIDRYITTKEIAVYLKKDTNNFFFYKKERLYDKTLGKKDIEQTYIDDVLKGNEVFEKTTQMKWQKNIITGKDYDESVGFVYALQICDEGVFVVHLEETIDDPALHYDLLKLISSIVFAKLKDQEKKIKYIVL